MISFDPFWKKCEECGENWYTLHNKHGISFSTLHRLKHNKPISTTTINDLCQILNCNVKDIAVYVPSDNDQLL